MITAILMGGLGNQMLQYATAKALALRLNTELKIDLSFYALHGAKDWCRAYEMDAIFPVSAQTIKVNFWGKLRCQLIALLAKKGKKKWLIRCGVVTNLSQIPTLSPNRNWVLFDYFFSDNQFSAYRSHILKEFSFKLPLNEANCAIAEQIGNSPCAVSIHVRRGDYLSNHAAASTFANISPSYYTEAMAYIEQKEPQPPTYFVFSDDIAWCKTFLPENCVFVNCNHGGDSYNDMRLMSLCQHNIIANSTFSWWAAWLNTNTEKLVIAPKKWYKNPLQNANHDRYPSGVICL